MAQQISPPYACSKCGVGDAAAYYEGEDGNITVECVNPNCAQDAALRLMPSKFVEVMEKQNTILSDIRNILMEKLA